MASFEIIDPSCRIACSSRRLAWAALALAAPALLAACGKKAPDEGSQPAAASASPAAPSGSVAVGAAAPTDGPKPVAAQGPKSLAVTIKDLQLFHPYSADRTMPSVKEDGTWSTRESKFRYGVGLIVEATNETGELLRDAWFEGDLRFISGSQEVKCDFNADLLGDFSPTFALAYAPRPPGKPADTAFDPVLGYPGPASDWKSESDSTTESVWRPAERVRMAARKTECESPLLGDLEVSQIRGRVVVKARKRFVESFLSEFEESAFDLALIDDAVRIRDKASSRVVVVPVRENVVEMVAKEASVNDARPVLLSKVRLRSDRPVRAWEADMVESAPVEFELHPRALSLQLVKLPSGEMVHASANVLVRLKEGKVVYEDMARQKLSLLAVERQDVPAALPEVSFQVDELSGKVTNVSLVHHSDEPALTKGQRRLSVTWKLNIRGGDIEGRLKARVDATTTELDQAERAAVAADLDTSADPAVVAKAKADLTKAKAAKTAAETKYKTDLAGERGRLTKLLSCGDIKLATNRGVKAPSNGKAAGDACKALEKGDEAEVTVAYTLERYELPVALVYSVGKSATFSPIASEPLIRMDPR